MVRHQLEDVWGLFKDPCSASDVLQKRWDEIHHERKQFLVHDLKQRVTDLVGTPLEYMDGDIEIDVIKREVSLLWRTRQAYDTKREAQKSSARLLQKILRMKRHRNPPPEWEKYLQLRAHWPAKASSVMPLPDPDTVAKNPALYKTQLDMLSAINAPNRAPNNAPPLTTVMSEYLALCLKTA